MPTLGQQPRRCARHQTDQAALGAPERGARVDSETPEPGRGGEKEVADGSKLQVKTVD